MRFGNGLTHHSRSRTLRHKGQRQDLALAVEMADSVNGPESPYRLRTKEQIAFGSSRWPDMGDQDYVAFYRPCKFANGVGAATAIFIRQDNTGAVAAEDLNETNLLLGQPVGI